VPSQVQKPPVNKPASPAKRKASHAAPLKRKGGNSEGVNAKKPRTEEPDIEDHHSGEQPAAEEVAADAEEKPAAEVVSPEKEHQPAAEEVAADAEEQPAAKEVAPEKEGKPAAKEVDADTEEKPTRVVLPRATKKASVVQSRAVKKQRKRNKTSGDKLRIPKDFQEDVAKELNTHAKQLQWQFSVVQARKINKISSKDFTAAFEEFKRLTSLSHKQKVSIFAQAVVPTREKTRRGHAGHITSDLLSKRSDFVGTVIKHAHEAAKQKRKKTQKGNAGLIPLKSAQERSDFAGTVMEHAREESHRNDDGDDAAASEHRHANVTKQELQQLKQRMEKMEKSEREIGQSVREMNLVLEQIGPQIEKLMEMMPKKLGAE